MLIGSHVSMSGKEMLLGSVKEALSYNATTFMFYTGAPQNTARKPIDQLRVEEAKQLMEENGIDINNVVVHAPYIINLANTIKEETYEKYAQWLEKGKKFDKFFAVAIFFPCAPDDFLCMLAGLTKMSWKRFSAIILLGKPGSIAIYSLALVYAGTWISGLQLI